MFINLKENQYDTKFARFERRQLIGSGLSTIQRPMPKLRHFHGGLSFRDHFETQYRSLAESEFNTITNSVAG